MLVVLATSVPRGLRILTMVSDLSRPVFERLNGFSVNAVIFLCPMSGFDQQLAEDNKANRLVSPLVYSHQLAQNLTSFQQDSMELWQTVCRSKLLANSTFILLLNKADLLFAKLKTVQFADHVPGYEDRPNKAEYVADFLREQMIAVHRKYSPKKRQLHHHVTCAIVRFSQA